jgi:WD40 repeat protein
VVSLAHGKLFSGSYDCSIRVWDLTTFRRVRSLHGHTDAVRSLAVAGRGFHSFTSKLNLKRFCHSKYTLNTRQSLLQAQTPPEHAINSP